MLKQFSARLTSASDLPIGTRSVARRARTSGRSRAEARTLCRRVLGIPAAGTYHPASRKGSRESIDPRAEIAQDLPYPVHRKRFGIRPGLRSVGPYRDGLVRQVASASLDETETRAVFPDPIGAGKTTARPAARPRRHGTGGGPVFARSRSGDVPEEVSEGGAGGTRDAHQVVPSVQHEPTIRCVFPVDQRIQVARFAWRPKDGQQNRQVAPERPVRGPDREVECEGRRRGLR